MKYAGPTATKYEETIIDFNNSKTDGIRLVETIRGRKSQGSGMGPMMSKSMRKKIIAYMHVRFAKLDGKSGSDKD